MDILLVNPPSIVEKTMNTQPVPIGLYSICQVLLEKGYSAKIVNYSKCKTWDEVSEEVKEIGHVDIVGISCYTRQRFSVAYLARLIKDVYRNCIVCLGGPHASFLAKKILEFYPWIDYIVRDEGELTFLELAEYIESKQNNTSSLCEKDILGLCYRNDEGVICNKSREPVSSLDLLPNILLPPKGLEYLSMSPSLLFHFTELENTERIAPILTSRGCAGICKFCCNKAFWGEQRFCSGRYVIEQIRHYYQMGIRCFDFYDDNFTSNALALRELAKYVEKEKVQIQWWCSSRADYITHEIAFLLKRAGCFMVSLGVESGSQMILNGIRKNLSVDTIKKASSILRDNGIALRVTISIGHQGESESTIAETLALVNEIKPSQIALFLLKVYPGTPLYAEMIENKLLDDGYWFDEENDIVPLYTIEHNLSKLREFQLAIEKGICGSIINKYEDELGSVELDLKWED